mmetsp:Transcript_15277/g.21782  ORF Transcript_15277/g.21782 Transcript_15277/m.21782 type:complete len:192 (+) Transcript_15277:111-686(+)
MEPIPILSSFSAPTEDFRNEPSPQDAERLLSEPLLASPNPSMLTADGILSYSQRTNDLDPVDFFENPKCTGTPLGALNAVSFTPFHDGADTLFTFEESVPFLEEEMLDPTINIGCKQITESKSSGTMKALGWCKFESVADCLTKAFDEKADITDSTLDEPSTPPDCDETSLFTSEEVLPAASPDSFPIAEV